MQVLSTSYKYNEVEHDKQLVLRAPKQVVHVGLQLEQSLFTSSSYSFELQEVTQLLLFKYLGISQERHVFGASGVWHVLHKVLQSSQVFVLLLPYFPARQSVRQRPPYKYLTPLQLKQSSIFGPLQVEQVEWQALQILSALSLYSPTVAQSS